MNDLTNKVAVITGAASGIGRAIAKCFASINMNVVIVDIEEAPLRTTESELLKAGAEVFSRQVDVSSAAQMEDLEKAVLDHFGAVHVICNNAGVIVGGPTWKLDTEDWEYAINTNLWGVIHGVRVFAKHLVKQDEGHIVNTASVAGLISEPELGPYNVTKHGIVTLSETLQSELSEMGSKVRVSVLCPGFVRTRIWDSDRNRSKDLCNKYSRLPDEYRRLRKAETKKRLENAMDADVVAKKVLHAVTNGEFYIFTHKATLDAVKEREQRILNKKSPTRTSINDYYFLKD